jgi:single-strand DNA-binding protein
MRGMSMGILAGTVGNHPELFTGKTGAHWTRLSVAVNRYDHQKAMDVTDWWDVTLFGKSAERAHKIIQPGVGLVVRGDLEIERWTDQEGRARKTTKMKADDFTIQHFPRDRDTDEPRAASTEPVERDDEPELMMM